MKSLFKCLILSAGALTAWNYTPVATAQAAPQRIEITAKKFAFAPSEITVKKGIPVTLELISTDRHHGFKLSAFQLRADIKPGSVEKVRFVPDRAGTFTFLCDVFCGDRHEEMSGTLTVIE